MGLTLTEDHRALAEVARSLLADRHVRGASRAALDGAADATSSFWKDIVALGWLAR